MNRNNHPFVNADRSIALAHNGRITDDEYLALKCKYEVASDCDSEILLRIFEAAGRNADQAALDFPAYSRAMACRLAGLRDIFSLINFGHMAVAIGERAGSDRSLWLFRNYHRSLWVADVREALGQIFFCSTPEIWRESVRDCQGVANCLGNSQKLIELPTEEVWYFSVGETAPQPAGVQRFAVAKDSSWQPWAFDGERHAIERRPATCEVVTRLGEGDVVLEGKAGRPPNIDKDYNNVRVAFDALRHALSQAETRASNLLGEQSMSREKYDRLLEALAMHTKDIVDTFRLLEE